MPDDEDKTTIDTDDVKLFVIGGIHLQAIGERFPIEEALA
jgi:hypothetical protein